MRLRFAWFGGDAGEAIRQGFDLGLIAHGVETFNQDGVFIHESDELPQLHGGLGDRIGQCPEQLGRLAFFIPATCNGQSACPHIGDGGKCQLAIDIVEADGCDALIRHAHHTAALSQFQEPTAEQQAVGRFHAHGGTDLPIGSEHIDFHVEIPDVLGEPSMHSRGSHVSRPWIVVLGVGDLEAEATEGK